MSRAARTSVVLAVAVALVVTGCTASPQSSPASSSTPAAPATNGPLSNAPTSPSLETPTGRILFLRLYNNAEGLNREAYLVFDVATGEVLEAPWILRSVVGWQWLPDGSGIAVGGLERGVDFFSGDRAEPQFSLPTLEGTRNAAFSPDGRWIATVGSGLGLAAADGSHGSEQINVETFDWGDATRPQLAWSPDSRSIAFISQAPMPNVPQSNSSSLAIFDREARITRQLALGVAGGLSWSPDGTQIAFLGSGPEAKVEEPEMSGCIVCALDVASAKVRSVVPDMEAIGGPRADGLEDHVTLAGWRDARTIVAFRTGLRPAAYLLDVQSGNIKELLIQPALTVFGGGILPPELSPDGRWLAISFEQPGIGTFVGVFDLDLGVVGPITTADGSSRTHDVFALWQPAPFPLLWQPWAAPTPEPTQTLFAATGHLEVSGALKASLDVAGTCSGREDGVSLDLGPDHQIQLDVTSKGSITFFGLSVEDFGAGSGKGFEASPPWVVVESGAGPTSGALTFHDVPEAAGEGTVRTVSGRVTWSCPDFRP